MGKELQTALAALVTALTALINLELGKAPPAKGDKKSAAPKVEEESFDESGDVNAEEEEDDTEETEEETDEGSDEEEGDEKKSLEEVIDAIKTFVDKNKNGEKDKAIALLKKKFKTGNVNKLEPEQYAEAIKLFSKK